MMDATMDAYYTAAVVAEIQARTVEARYRGEWYAAQAATKATRKAVAAQRKAAALGRFLPQA